MDGITGNLNGLFKDMNDRIGEIATQVGATPGNWNPGVFSLIRQLSETIVLSIVGLVLTFVMCYELIQMLADRNNLHDTSTWILSRWVLKTFITVLLLSNAFNIVMAVFDVSQSIINGTRGVTTGNTAVSPSMMDSLETQLMTMEIDPLLGLWVQSFLMKIIVVATNIVVFVIVYGRMIETYLLTSLAPVSMTTLVNREVSGIGQNYLKSPCAVGPQGLLILVCMGVYAKLVQSIAVGGDPIRAIWTVIGYTVLLCLIVFKAGSLAKPIFGAHWRLQVIQGPRQIMDLLG